MEPLRKSARLLSLVMITAAIAACGGGGGGTSAAPSPGPAPSPVPPPPPPPPPPSPPVTGLPDPTLTLSTSVDINVQVAAFRQLASQMAEAYIDADNAQAAREVSLLAPGAGGSPPASFNCPGGVGTISITNGSSLTYSYSNCATNGYGFNGGGTLTPTVNGGVLASYTLQYNGLAATGPNSFSDALAGTSACKVDGSTTSCVITLGGFIWGYDSTFADGKANGTHRCTCSNGSWNVLFTDFTATSGIAYVYAQNGTAIATRTGVKTFSVQQTLTGGSPVTFDVTIP